MNEIPYWCTASNPDFHTNVTSQAFVAWSLQDKKADTALPPTTHTFIRGLASILTVTIGTPHFNPEGRGKGQSSERQIRIY